MKSYLISISFLLFSLTLTGQNIPIELGTVDWMRNYEKAIEQSQGLKRPILILFQEVPGCHTCSTYGKNVLSHPLLVEIIEDSFIPLAIFNNKGGHDRKILSKFGEPTWNNPVVRIVDQEGTDIIPRINGRYTKEALLEGMLSALEQSNVVIPTWMRLFQQEIDPGSPLKKATFSMGCFWSGEGRIGQIDGVVSTRAGWMSGREVVEIKYDPSIVSYKNLLANASDLGVAKSAFTNKKEEKKLAESKKIQVLDLGDFRDDREPKYYTQNTYYKYLPMTELQASKVNAALGKRQDAKAFLSPRQIALYSKIEKQKGKGYEVCIQKDFISAMKVLN